MGNGCAIVKSVVVEKTKSVWIDDWTKMQSTAYWRLQNYRLDTHYFYIDNAGFLCINLPEKSVRVHDLVKKHGPTLDVFVPYIVTERVKTLYTLFQNAINYNKYNGRFIHCYPLKSNPHYEIVINAIKGGSNLEVGSLNELIAVASLYEDGIISNEKITVCNGIKNKDYLKKVLEMIEKGYNLINIIESHDEFERIVEYLNTNNPIKNINIGIRVKLKVNTNGHWNASKPENRFGFPAEDVLLFAKQIKEYEKLKLKLIHYHLGSQIEDKDGDVIIDGLKSIMDLYADVKSICPTIDTINTGGGFAVAYDGCVVCDIDMISNRMIQTLKECSNYLGVDEPNLIVESGRWVAAPAQLSVFEVVDKKQIVHEDANIDAKEFYVIDGSFMTDLPDTWGVQQTWWPIPLDQLNINPKNYNKVWLAGSTCDSDDYYKHPKNGGYLMLPELNGKPLYISILNTGAYQDAIGGISGGHLCMLPEAKKIELDNNGNARVLVPRQTPAMIQKLFGWKRNGYNC